ncbi:flagellar biosynthetic protein FliO [Halomonas denitrificans]|uniref:flagellar biosynthetic protein FliO n=1 Tax=Halomonas denitrificans TaxID=370769 RepID=UPI001C9A0292|nr:flagellar biosynthetic protein FliO [Halomonas denitrificans]MBY5967849.1 flagellar biosynthetic protein FliO [Halomonas denitrificans]
MNETTTSAAIDGLAQGGDGLLGLAMLGKTAAALALIIAILFGLSALIKRRSGGLHGQPGRLKIIGSTAVGQRERVVVVQVQDRWLVLGVGAGRVNRLDSLPAPEEPELPASSAEADSFGERFAQALKTNLGQRPR